MTTMTVVAMGGLGVLTVAWVAAISFRKASASLRHSIWLAGLLALLVLPVMEMADVRVEIPVPAEFSLALPAWSAGGAGVPAVETDVPSGGVSKAAGYASESVGHASAESSGHASMAWTGHAGETTADAGVARGAAVAGIARGAQTPAPGTRGRPASLARAPRDLRPGPAPAAALGLVQSNPVFALWLGVALLLVTATTLGHVRARYVATSEVGPPSRAALDRLGAARLEMGVERDVRLVVSKRVAVPATWGLLRPVIVLPPGYRDWSPATLDRVLLHELAHVARRDCETYLIGDLARALHWFNPLAWFATRSLRAESERACDDRVLEVVRPPSAYAADLVAMVRAVAGSGGVPRAALAMAHPGSVSDRVRAILDPSRSRARVRAPAAASIGAVALGLVLSATVVTPTAKAAVPAPEESPAPALGATAVSAPSPEPIPDVAAAPTPAPQERLCIFRADGRRSTSHHEEDNEVRIRWETDECRVDIDIIGAVQFAADDRSVVALGSDARFEIEERFGRSERRARLEGRAGGGMERRFWEDGDEIAWGPAADRWLASILPEIFRHTTINAEARVRRMVDEGGPDQVFAEVSRIQSDHVSRRYLELLMEATELDEGDYRRVIEAAASIDSDHGSAELLLAVVARAGLRPSFQAPLLAASEGLDSDHQRTRVLRVLLDSPLSGEQLDAVLQSASSIESDHNLGELLASIAAAGRMDDAGRTSFLETLRSVESDHQQAMVIHAFLDAGPLSDAELARVLALTDYLESDHQRAEILQRVARDFDLEGDQVSAYLRSAAGMESDHQKAATALTITERADFERDQTLLVLRIADEVESDHQQATILGGVIRRRSLDDAEMFELLRVARAIDSSHQLGTVVGLLLDEQEFGSATLLELLDVVGAIDSSHQKSEALLHVARRYDLSGAARDRYTQLAGTVGSRERERLMAAISG